MGNVHHCLRGMDAPAFQQEIYNFPCVYGPVKTERGCVDLMVVQVGLTKGRHLPDRNWQNRQMTKLVLTIVVG